MFHLDVNNILIRKHHYINELRVISKKYGPVYSLRLGVKDVVIITDIDIADICIVNMSLQIDLTFIFVNIYSDHDELIIL